MFNFNQSKKKNCKKLINLNFYIQLINNNMKTSKSVSDSLKYQKLPSETFEISSNFFLSTDDTVSVSFFKCTNLFL